MTQRNHSTELHPAVESILENGFGGLLESMKIIFNEAMKAERSTALEAGAYERTESSRGYANGFKNKTIGRKMVRLIWISRRSVETFLSTHRLSRRG